MKTFRKPASVLFFAVLFLLSTALACSTSSLAENSVPSGGVLYQDIFSSPKSGWGMFDGKAGVAAYSDGAYHMYVISPNMNLWAHPGMDFSTVRVEVLEMAASGPQENRTGVICRMKDDANFYFFVISADGYYGIGKVKDGKWTLLNGDQMQHTDAILGGTQVNRIRADCIGKILILYVNDIFVGSAEDADFASGDVGVLAGSFGTPGVDVYFDNFVVYKP